eukprot:2240250-Pleurochrysis_carterae.AAC.3
MSKAQYMDAMHEGLVTCWKPALLHPKVGELLVCVAWVPAAAGELAILVKTGLATAGNDRPGALPQTMLLRKLTTE